MPPTAVGYRSLRQAHASVPPTPINRPRAQAGTAAAAEGGTPAPLPFGTGEFTPLVLVSNEKTSHDTHVLRYALPAGTSAALPVASCVSVRGPAPADGTAPDADRPARPYTPTSKPDDTHLELVVKRYEAGVVSKALCDAAPGSAAEFKGPWKKMSWVDNSYAAVGMVAGGTGLTPMLQVLEEALERGTARGDATRFTLLSCHRREADLLLRDRVEALEKAFPDRLRVLHVVEKADSKDWKGGVGRVDRALLDQWMPPANLEGGSMVCVCGPPPMVAAVAGPKGEKGSQGEAGGLFAEMGFTSDNIYKF